MSLKREEKDKIKEFLLKTIHYAENYFNIFVIIKDNGIGIFRKIVRDHNLKNEKKVYLFMFNCNYSIVRMFWKRERK